MHYQLLELGLSQRQVVIVIYLVCGILGSHRARALAAGRPALF